MTRDELDAGIDRLLAREFPSLASLSDDAYFVDEGALDSFEFIRLMSEIERSFEIKIRDDDVSEENFGSKQGIRRFLAARLQVGAGAG